MNSAFASAIARLIMHRVYQAEHGKLQRAAMGVTAAQIGRKKVIFDTSQFYREDPFCGWWVMVNKPAGSGEIIFKELAGVVMAHVDPVGRVAGAIGGPVASVHGAYGKATTAQRAAPTNSIKERADGIYNQFNDAWKAGTWSAARGTRQEFTIAREYFLAGGFLTMDVGSKGEITGRCCYYDSDDKMDTALTQAEHRGLGESGLQYCLEMSKGSFMGHGRSYEYSAETGKLKIG